MKTNKSNGTSRKTKGAAVHNREQVREIVETKQDLGNGKYVLTDKGGNLIYVNTKDGLTGAIVDNGYGGLNINYYATGETSGKDNGYVYTPVVITDTNGKNKTIEYGTHAIIAMVEFTADYDNIVDSGKTPEVNHKNNCKWCNKSSNLEWTTKGGNTRHGKIVASLHHYYTKYTHIEHNLSTTDFVVLDKPISVHDIARYCDLLEDGAVFKVENNEYIDGLILSCFVDWLKREEIW